MTTYSFPFHGLAFALTDEVSASSYGQPVLMDAAGVCYAADEIVIPAELESADSLFAPRPALSARYIVANRDQPVEISDADFDLIIKFAR